MMIFRAIKMLPVVALFGLAACTQESVGNAVQANAPSALAAFTVYKDPQCSCCSLWVEHMEDAGFQLQTRNIGDVSPIKRDFGIGLSQQSCHTAVWDNGQTRYVFEGHVPAALVQRFLQEKPENARGLLVPGMPVGSPGMEQGNLRMPYDVLLLKSDGATEVYAHVDGNVAQPW